ncbi:hypothetical protein P5915_03290 [Acholeplasma manati]|nr:hypothetical protein [Paracholeplasma manati]
MISNRQKITSHDNIYEVKEPGTLQMEYESKISFDIDVKAEVLPLPGANIFYLKYYRNNTLVAHYKVTILSVDDSMSIELFTRELDHTKMAFVSYDKAGQIGFRFERITQNVPVSPFFMVSVVPTDLQFMITFWIQFLLFMIVLIVNIVNARTMYVYHISVATYGLTALEKIKYVALGVFIPPVGALIYVVGGTNLYDEQKVLKGNYSGAGTAVTILIYIIYRTIVKIG